MNAPFSKRPALFRNLGVIFLAWVAAGCHREGSTSQPNMPPPQVEVVTIQPRSLPLTAELPGRIDPVRIATVTARVDGVVLRQEFVQGSNVTNGQVLYQIDPAPYQAALDSAKASLSQARSLMQRYKPLVGINAVSRQNYDNAVSAAAQAKASQEIAAINLGYCTVTAPIPGRIGAALVTEGALVSQSAATQMAVIQQMDPIYFDFTEASAEVLKLRRELAAGQLEGITGGGSELTLELPDGTAYARVGKLLFTDVSVDPSSSMVALRAEFPNPETMLLPGMFAVGKLEQAVAPKTMLMPQRGVVIGPTGSASVLLVRPDNRVQSQPVQLGTAVGTDWIVKSGLKAGDRVIVDGLQKAKPGMQVQPMPFQPAAENTDEPPTGQ